MGPNQVNYIIDVISNALGTMQMVDYPYSTNFLGLLPANPVKTACTQAQAIPVESDIDYVRKLQVMLNIFQNTS